MYAIYDIYYGCTYIDSYIPVSLPKSKRWECREYLNWVATLPCVNCGLDDDTIVAHHLKHRYAPHGGGGVGLKANDFLTMPLCFNCHDKAHNGDRDVLDWQADFIFKTLDKAFRAGILNSSTPRGLKQNYE